MSKKPPVPYSTANSSTRARSNFGAPPPPVCRTPPNVVHPGGDCDAGARSNPLSAFDTRDVSDFSFHIDLNPK